MAEWYVAKDSEFQEGSCMIVHAGETQIGVYQRKGSFYAYENICRHQGGPVCEGSLIGKVQTILDDDKSVIEEIFSQDELHIVCPWHGWEYNLETGESVGDKRFRLKRYEVLEREGEVYVIL